MTKADIVNEISKGTGVEKAQVQQIVEAFMESIKDSLTSNKNVYLRGFGASSSREERRGGPHISKNTTITTLPTTSRLKPAKSFAAK